MNPVLGLVGQLKMSAHPKSKKLVLICSKNPFDIYLHKFRQKFQKPYCIYWKMACKW